MNNIVKNISFALLCLTTLSLGAQPQITRKEAIKVAANALMIINRDSNNESERIVDSVFTLTKSGNTLMYEVLFTTGERVLLSGHRGCLPVLGIIDNDCLNNVSLIHDGSYLPDGLRSLLDDYAAQIDYCFHNTIGEYYSEKWNAFKQTIDTSWAKSMVYIPPMLTTKWGQDSSNDSKHNYVDYTAYNAYTPHGDYCNHCFAGCSAVAMAQILKYYNSPQESPSQCSRYSWNNMPDSLRRWHNSSYNSQKDAVARLISDCGIAMDMDYCSDTSHYYPYSCTSSTYNLEQVVKALRNYSYINAYPWHESQCASHSEWVDKVAIELFNLRPLYYIAYRYKGGKLYGHAFVCDGYVNVDNLFQSFHINWGWNGKQNGWFTLDNLNPSSLLYDRYHGAIFNIYPTTCYQNIIMECDTSFSSQTLKTFSAVDSFQNNQHVFQTPTSACIHIYAGKDIFLTDGFHVAEGSDFYAAIASCGSASLATSPDILTNNNGTDNPTDTLPAPKSWQTETIQSDDAALTVYPNPTDDLLFVELRGAEIARVALYDLQGRMVTGAGAHAGAPQQGTTATMNMRNVPAGVYLLRVTAADGKEYHRKVVKR